MTEPEYTEYLGWRELRVEEIRLERAKLWRECEPPEIASAGVERRADWWLHEVPKEVSGRLRELARDEWALNAFECKKRSEGRK